MSTAPACRNNGPFFSSIHRRVKKAGHRKVPCFFCLKPAPVSVRARSVSRCDIAWRGWRRRSIGSGRLHHAGCCSHAIGTDDTCDQTGRQSREQELVPIPHPVIAAWRGVETTIVAPVIDGPAPAAGTVITVSTVPDAIMTTATAAAIISVSAWTSIPRSATRTTTRIGRSKGRCGEEAASHQPCE